jgi:two-component system response regulator HydG
MTARILLVDDDPSALESTRKILELAKYEVITAVDGQAALDLLRPSPNRASALEFDLVVTDVRMPRLGGLEFLRALSLCGDQIPVILMTAFGRVEDAVWAMKLGAVDFLTKPFKRQALLSSVDGALKRASRAGYTTRMPAEAVTSGDANAASASHRPIVGSSEWIRSLRAMIRQVAPTAATVLITGESGTGKELVARSLHEQSTRAKAPLIALNCAAVPEQLIESELFGFEKGAFTGATTSKGGLFEAAHGGTLLLDEIGDMPISLQAKLLRVLQEGEVRRVGASISRKVDVRLIAATHQNLHEQVAAGKFRQDLLYRLEVVHLQVPALRDRLNDLPEVAYSVLKQASEKHAKAVHTITPDAMQILMTHRWPGNIRELSNVIERAVIFAEGESIRTQDLPDHLTARLGEIASSLAATSGAAAHSTPGGHAGQTTIAVPLGTSLKDVEELLIRKTLEATSGDKNMTAKLLGINSRTIYRKLASQEGCQSSPELQEEAER